MAGNGHGDVSRFFPGVAEARCDGVAGWAAITAADGADSQGRCPLCAADRIRDALGVLVPPRFRMPVTVPPQVSAWAEMGADGQGLYLTGPVGTGKTHAAWSAATAWCLRTGTVPVGEVRVSVSGAVTRPNVIFSRMTDLLDDLRPGDGARDRIRDCQNAALLVIDDIGAEKTSEWTQERLYSVIDHRYANCLPLIVTSNLPPKQLAPQTGARAASRLSEMCAVVAMTGEDRRKPRAA